MAFNNSGLNFRRVDRLLKANAEQVQVYSATPCTCGTDPDNPGINRTNPNCPACGGWGYIYAAPRLILALATGYDVKRNPLDMAIVEPGDMMLIPLPRERVWLQTGDKVMFPKWEDAEAYEGEIIVRDVVGPDRLSFAPVIIDRVTNVDRDGTIHDWLPGTDYTMSGNALTWVAGSGPQPYGSYSVRYRARYNWIVFSPPNPRYARGTDIGQRVLLRKQVLVHHIPSVSSSV